MTPEFLMILEQNIRKPRFPLRNAQILPFVYRHSYVHSRSRRANETNLHSAKQYWLMAWKLGKTYTVQVEQSRKHRKVSYKKMCKWLEQSEVGIAELLLIYKARITRYCNTTGRPNNFWLCLIVNCSVAKTCWDILYEPNEVTCTVQPRRSDTSVVDFWT